MFTARQDNAAEMREMRKGFFYEGLDASGEFTNDIMNKIIDMLMGKFIWGPITVGIDEEDSK